MKYTKPIVDILRIYQEPVRNVSASIDSASYRNLKGAVAEIEALENSYRSRLGLPSVSGMPAISLGERRIEVQRLMKSDSKWTALYRDVLGYSGTMPTASLEEQIGAIGLPDWNSLTAKLIGLNVNDGSIHADFGVAHSYATQLNRRGMLEEGSLQPISVYGNVITPDKKTLMGIRGGMSFVGGHMPLPAGSLYLTEKDGQPVIDPFVAFRKELKDETGLQPEKEDVDYIIDGILGIFVERTSCNTHGLVFSVSILKTEQELADIWNRYGNKEHDIIFFKPEDEMPDYIIHNADRRPYMTQTVDAGHPLLPSGAATLLVQLGRASRTGFERTIDSFGGLYAVI